MPASDVLNILDRKADIMGAQPRPHTPLRSIAEQLTRRNLASAHAELLNEALQRCTSMLYESDASNRLCNVDENTGRILLPVPWGRAGHRQWGLRYTESQVLRAILLAHQKVHDQGKRPALYLYDTDTRAWLLNLFDFASSEAGLQRIQQTPISPAQWRVYVALI